MATHTRQACGMVARCGLSVRTLQRAVVGSVPVGSEPCCRQRARLHAQQRGSVPRRALILDCRDLQGLRLAAPPLFADGGGRPRRVLSLDLSLARVPPEHVDSAMACGDRCWGVTTARYAALLRKPCRRNTTLHRDLLQSWPRRSSTALPAPVTRRWPPRTAGSPTLAAGNEHLIGLPSPPVRPRGAEPVTVSTPRERAGQRCLSAAVPSLPGRRVFTLNASPLLC